MAGLLLGDPGSSPGRGKLSLTPPHRSPWFIRRFTSWRWRQAAEAGWFYSSNAIWHIAIYKNTNVCGSNSSSRGSSNSSRGSSNSSRGSSSRSRSISGCRWPQQQQQQQPASDVAWTYTHIPRRLILNTEINSSFPHFQKSKDDQCLMSLSLGRTPGIRIRHCLPRASPRVIIESDTCAPAATIYFVR